jgi:hypothetical protein
MPESKHEHVDGAFRAVSVAEAATDPRSVGDAVRSVIAGGAAARVIASSVALFEAGGKLLLDEGTKSVLRGAAERGAESALAFAAGPLLGPATMLAKKPIGLLANAGKAARAAAPLAARAAGKEILKGAGKAAGIGLAIDGAVASVEAVIAVRDGSMDRTSAVGYVATEAATGAVATGAGVLLGAGLVALTGGAAAPVVFAVGALGSIGTKRLLRRFTTHPSRDLAVREVEAPSTTV